MTTTSRKRPIKATGKAEPKTQNGEKNTTVKKVAPRRKAATAPGLLLLQIQTPANAGQPPADDTLKPYTLPVTGLHPLIDGLRQLSLDPRTQNSHHWGLMPDNLTQRTGYTGQQLQAAIESRPGYDVYFCHAQPELEAVYHNPWMQAEANQPGFLVLAKEFLAAAGLSDKAPETLTHSAAFATGHMLVASPDFWTPYLDFIDQVLHSAQNKLSPAIRETLFAPPRSTPRPGQMSLLQLITARLTGLYLMRPNQPWKICKLTTPQEAQLNPHLRLLREMKDAAIEQQSGWLTACWANYRALYLAQTAGSVWMNTHRRAINPVQLHLGSIPAQLDYPYTTTTQVRFK